MATHLNDTEGELIHLAGKTEEKYSGTVRNGGKYYGSAIRSGLEEKTALWLLLHAFYLILL